MEFKRLCVINKKENYTILLKLLLKIPFNYNHNGNYYKIKYNLQLINFFFLQNQHRDTVRLLLTIIFWPLGKHKVRMLKKLID